MILPRPNYFILAMVAAIGLAWMWPSIGAKNSSLHPETLSKMAVALVFFLNGALISFDAVKDGARNWRAHFLIQVITFVVFPVLGLVIIKLGGAYLGPDLSLGIFFLCALPSTVSSSVAITAQSKGNVALALFNATLSSLVGVILTPLWMGYVLKTQNIAIDLMPVIINLACWIMLPLALGQFSRLINPQWLSPYRRWAQVADRTVIIWLIYSAFCDSFSLHIFDRFSLTRLFITSSVTIVILIIILVIILYLVKSLEFILTDKKAILFCSATKSLATGVPMAQMIFMGTGLVTGPLLLPILIYHPVQLLVFALVADRWADTQ